MVEPLRPSRGGFLRPFGCGEFIREFLLGNGPYGSPRIDPTIGAPQADIFYHYKSALMRETATDRAIREEERRAKREKRPIDPGNIESLSERYLARIPYKSKGCRYHSFVVYFSNLQRLGWVEPSNTGRPVIKVAKPIAEAVKLVRENFTAGLVAYANGVAMESPEAYKTQVDLARKAGKPIADMDRQALQAALASLEAQAEVKPQAKPQAEVKPKSKAKPKPKPPTEIEAKPETDKVLVPA